MGTLFALLLWALPPLQTVDKVELQRYTGTWFEAARLPNRFQRQCVSDVRAEYTLRPDGKIEVINRCKNAAGKLETARGTARLAAAGQSAKLKVTFFWPFSGNYWIIGLDPEYKWAVVGEPDRKYLWILTREKRIDDAQLAPLIELAERQGYDVGKLQRTPQ